MRDLRRWIESLRAVLEQGVELVERLDAAEYGRVHHELGASSVGAHLRHGVNFVQSFASGIDDRRIDYDARVRDPRLERDPRYAVRVLAALAREIATLDHVDGLEPIWIRSDAPADATPAEAWQRSTIGRELVSVLSHTVHHYAFMALLLRARGIEPGAEFGVAPSTLAHWRSRAESCTASS